MSFARKVRRSAGSDKRKADAKNLKQAIRQHQQARWQKELEAKQA